MKTFGLKRITLCATLMLVATSGAASAQMVLHRGKMTVRPAVLHVPVGYTNLPNGCVTASLRFGHLRATMNHSGEGGQPREFFDLRWSPDGSGGRSGGTAGALDPDVQQACDAAQSAMAIINADDALNHAIRLIPNRPKAAWQSSGHGTGSRISRKISRAQS